MKMKKCLDLHGCLYFGITISLIIGLWFNINNISNCITTYNYQVWVCSVNSQIILITGLSILWFIMTFFYLVNLFCIKEVKENGK
jgi:hypothetical protein